MTYLLSLISDSEWKSQFKDGKRGINLRCKLDKYYDIMSLMIEPDTKPIFGREVKLSSRIRLLVREIIDFRAKMRSEKDVNNQFKS